PEALSGVDGQADALYGVELAAVVEVEPDVEVLHRQQGHRRNGSSSTVSVRASASSVQRTPSGSDARCFPWPSGSLYSTGTPSGSRCSSSTSSSDRLRAQSDACRRSPQSQPSISPTTTPATPASVPACPSCVSIPST